MAGAINENTQILLKFELTREGTGCKAKIVALNDSLEIF